MISAVLLFLGATFIYTGFLAVASIGLILIVKPALKAARFCRSQFGGDPRMREPTSGQKGKVRKIHLKIIKSKDDNPTIH
jgi:hypothetical protein